MIDIYAAKRAVERRIVELRARKHQWAYRPGTSLLTCENCGEGITEGNYAAKAATGCASLADREEYRLCMSDEMRLGNLIRHAEETMQEAFAVTRDAKRTLEREELKERAAEQRATAPEASYEAMLPEGGKLKALLDAAGDLLMLARPHDDKAAYTVGFGAISRLESAVRAVKAQTP